MFFKELWDAHLRLELSDPVLVVSKLIWDGNHGNHEPCGYMETDETGMVSCTKHLPIPKV